MTVETETILIKLLEELKSEFRAEIKELKTEIKDIKKDLTDIKTTQGIQGEQINGLKEDLKEVKNEIKGRISIQSYWFLSLLSVLVLLLSKVVFFPKP